MFLHPRLNVEKRMVLAACLDGIMAPGLVRGCQYVILPTGNKSTNLGPEREQQFKCCFANCKLPVTSEWNVVYAFKLAGNNVRLLESFLWTPMLSLTHGPKMSEPVRETPTRLSQRGFEDETRG